MENPNFSSLVTEIEKVIPGHDAYELANLVQLPGYKLPEKDIQDIANNIVTDELNTREALESYE